MKIIHHSLFGPHLQYGAQLLGQENFVNRNNIQNFQNRTLRKITFKKLHDPANPFFKDLKILKFKDLLYLQNCLFVSQIQQNKTLAKSFVTLKHCNDNHNYQTRASAKKIWPLLSIREILWYLYSSSNISLYCKS